MSDIYQHFRKDEESFIDQALEWKRIVAEQYRMKLTDFLDPREQVILQSVIGQSDDVRLEFFGGFPEAERKRAVLFPEYAEPSAEDFQVQGWEVIYPQKFASIEHRELLGSLMGIGLKRQKFGDLIFSDGTWQFICSEEVADFVFTQLTQIGKVKVSLEKIPLSKLKVPEQDVEIRDDTVSSLRLDAICSAMSRQSRQKAQVLVKNGLVKVNWKVIEDPSYALAEGDMVSIRGFGRFRMKNIDGKTKKGKWRLTFEKQK
ncbi:RNA-binding protein [Bacillus haynesii]|uniref:YlmH family RNA-binding protein n=1 Tax=Bacillus haynesii TaxID=1925021 RepID=UPI002281C01D|nr:RNA-binding protein [Bacillus haynesii]MCY7770485.1 RNA-binding protein [Bacillus haynesii]MCY8014154.1 RNA-binding protein [Bacillus haynesii]MEC0761884.1 RNA-binding protein [Bacillus haynesii]MEC0785519.1 RNA-binding protein [Bacillus haynesii]